MCVDETQLRWRIRTSHDHTMTYSKRLGVDKVWKGASVDHYNLQLMINVVIIYKCNRS